MLANHAQCEQMRLPGSNDKQQQQQERASERASLLGDKKSRTDTAEIRFWTTTRNGEAPARPQSLAVPAQINTQRPMHLECEPSYSSVTQESRVQLTSIHTYNAHGRSQPAINRHALPHFFCCVSALGASGGAGRICHLRPFLIQKQAQAQAQARRPPISPSLTLPIHIPGNTKSEKKSPL